MAAPPAFVIDGPIDRTDVLGLCDLVRVLVEDGDADPVVCDVGGLLDSHLGTVALLARLQLTARRLGGRIRVRNASAELHDTLALVGLCDVVGACPPLRREARRKTEHWEEARGVEKERDPADPIA